MDGVERYFPRISHPQSSWFAFAWWCLANPLFSAIGVRRIRQFGVSSWPRQWIEDFGGKRVAIIGSGPSLDLASPEFLNEFETRVYINHAASRIEKVAGSYIFTTDGAALIQFAREAGTGILKRLGPDRCVFAPIYQDQYRHFTPAGRALFSWLPPHETNLKVEAKHIGPFALPYTIRCHPRKPDLERLELVRHSPPAMPILEESSALSAILFATLNGARDIQLIGCDFSGGHAESLAIKQVAAIPGQYKSAAQTCRQLIEVLGKHGITLRNASLEV